MIVTKNSENTFILQLSAQLYIFFIRTNCIVVFSNEESLVSRENIRKSTCEVYIFLAFGHVKYLVHIPHFQ